MDQQRPVGAGNWRIADVTFFALKLDQIRARLVGKRFIKCFPGSGGGRIVNIITCGHICGIAVADYDTFFIQNTGTSGAANN